MSQARIFAGPRIRRIRTRLELTQAAMAERLDISTSYLNLIERDQRPLSAQLVVKLLSTFDITIEELQPGEGGSMAALKEVFADPLLSGELPGDTELMELADGAPNAALAIIKLHRAYREQQSRLSDLTRTMRGEGPMASAGGAELPVEEARRVLENAPWCFPALERAAERITNSLNAHTGRMAALYTLLRTDHGVSVQVLPVETMPDWRRRFDRHSRRLFLSERLPRWERAEMLAQELVLSREAEVLAEEVDLLGLKSDEAKRLARAELARYCALAVLMPYAKIQRLAERTRHDCPALMARFEVGFGQLAERLVSLQDRSAGHRAGRPFFAMQVDQSGNVLRRIGAKGFPSTRFGGNCPKLALHSTFQRPGELLAERVITTDGDVFFTLCSSVDGPQTGVAERPCRTAMLLGLEDAHAKAWCAAHDSDQPKKGTVFVDESAVLERAIIHAGLLPRLEQAPPLPVGAACRLCEREDCVSRSAPPLTRPFGLDELTEGFGAHGLS